MKKYALKINKKYFIFFLSIYLLILSVFFFTSIGTESYRFLLNMRRYFPVAVVVTLSFFYWNYYDFPIKKILPDCFIGIAWILTHNILDYFAYRNVSTNINNFFDIAFGGYIFSFLVLLRIFIYLVLKRPSRLVSCIFGAVQTVLLLVPLIELGYFSYYYTTISTAASIAFLQSNPNEVKEYLLQNIGVLGIFCFIVGVSLLCIFLIRQNKLEISSKVTSVGFRKNRKNFLVLLVFVFLIGIYLPKCFAGTGVIHSMLGAKQYLDNAKKFEQYHKEKFNQLQVISSANKFAKPSTIILVIGESAGRNFMSAYGYSGNDTTPWLRQSIENDGTHFLRFNHAYSSYGSTIQSLERALTEKNQYNNKDFSQSLTIIDLAKKAGYKTYWFSNQSVKNTADTPIQLVARTADVTHWVEDGAERNRVLYDGDLLPYLKGVNANENNFIVLHVMGSHELTLHRFPPEFTRFGTAGVFDLVSNYEDSMAYDDWVLQQIFLYAKDNLNLQAMIFFSDHGANPYRKRVADNIPFINLRIPLIIYLSDEYEQLYPQTTSILKKHENQYFTNDLMYELIGGILQIKSDHLDEKNDLSSEKFQFTRDTLKTDLGRKNIKDDYNEDKIE